MKHRVVPRGLAGPLILLAAALLVGTVGQGVGHAQERSYDAPEATITVDGNPDDWAAIPSLSVPMVGALDKSRTQQAELKMAHDSENVYLLVIIPDDFNATPGEHELSGSFAALFPIDEGAGPHMGTDGVNLTTSLGMVDIWHWEIDCGPGVLSGGMDREEDGDDPACNLDDEWATTPFEREDDDLNNFLTGAYDHSNRAAGEDAEGEWYWEISRPLQTGDPQDLQIEAGGSLRIALAYWDPDETPDGWTDAGHTTSADDGWITVNLVTAAPPAATPTPAAPAAAPVTGSGPLAQDGRSSGVHVGFLALIAVGAALALAGSTWVVLQFRRR